MKKSNEVSIGDAIKGFFKDFHLTKQVNEIQIKEIWVKIMGKTISQYTYEIKLVKDTLFIGINSAPLKQDLSYNKQMIADRLNEELGEQIIKVVVIK